MRSWVEQLLRPHIEKPELEVPPDPKLGDYAFACFPLAKAHKKSPQAIAKELAERIEPTDKIEKVVAEGPYLNFFIDKSALAKELLPRIFEGRDDFGKQHKNNKTVVLDYSSPNIAKPFGIGHLRSTVIGNALNRLHLFCGYKTIGINHLGDWGTQFGKEIAAWKKWGDEKKLEKDPIGHLLELYVRFHKEAEDKPELVEEGRDWFKKLEQGDQEAVELWKLFKEKSLEEFERLYRILDVHFDFYYGEAFYHKQADEIIERLEKKGLAEESEGALVVKVGLKHAPPLMLKKSDGTTTYHTRDLAAALYRVEELDADKVLYCVGSEQLMHFDQLFRALEMYGLDKDMFVHVVFGRYKFPEGSMSTRKGNIIFMEDVLDKAIALAQSIIEEKNPLLKNKEQVAQEVGVGAVVFGDLVNDRKRDIVFDWDRILDFEGETGPYVQYAHARCCSILRKAPHGPSPKVSFAAFEQDEEKRLIVALSRFKEVIDEAAHQHKPHLLARYLLDLAQSFSTFYQRCPVISEVKATTDARILLVDAIRQVLRNGLWLLGLKAPEEM